jgi:hypothetical protein
VKNELKQMVLWGFIGFAVLIAVSLFSIGKNTSSSKTQFRSQTSVVSPSGQLDIPTQPASITITSVPTGGITSTEYLPRNESGVCGTVTVLSNNELPSNEGYTVTASRADTLQAAGSTKTDRNGSYFIPLTPGTYNIFIRYGQKTVVVKSGNCAVANFEIDARTDQGMGR